MRKSSPVIFLGLAAVTAAALVLLPALATQALAWGPGVHLAAGGFVLDNLALLLPAVAAAIRSHREAFLYGCLSADIFIGKGLRLRPGHSHDWDTARRLDDTADTPELKAYAQGYMTHLAADIAAHNCYVPSLLRAYGARGKLTHVWVEMLADLKVDWNRAEARRLFALPLHSADASLRQATGNRRLTFLLKKHVFKQGLYITEPVLVRHILNGVEIVLPSADPSCNLPDMLDLTCALALDALRHPDSSPVFALDPMGQRRMRLATLRPERASFAVPEQLRHLRPASPSALASAG